MARIAVLFLLAAAAVPWLGPLDARILGAIEPWHGCAAQAIADRVSRAVLPLVIAALVLALVRRLRRGAGAATDVASALAALAAGSLVIEALKNLVDRPRPGAEFLGSAGNSFPSGHVGNTVLVGAVVLALWRGRAARPGPAGWLALGVVVMLVGLARVYGDRHWPSDAACTAVAATGYVILAVFEPDARRRAVTIVLALVVAGGLQVAASAGVRVAVPAGSRALAQPAIAIVTFGAAYGEKRLGGLWSLDGPDPRRSSAWLRSAAGRIRLGEVAGDVEELRIVGRPYPLGAACRWLRVTWNGRVLGRRLLRSGWRAYTFPLDLDSPPGSDEILLEVEGHPPGADGESAPRAAFSELTLHASGGAPSR